MADRIRWGILGAGKIARVFAEALQALPGAEIAAVASTRKEAAEAFGAEFAIPRRHASYEALAEDPRVDAVYIATLHPAHKANILLCLRAGKHVLCEKPLTINAAEAREAIQTARKEKRFLMEAMVTRFLPILGKVRQWIAQGRIGEPRLVQAELGGAYNYDSKSRFLDPALGGGVLLDLGVYPIALASMVFGGARPSRAASLAVMGATGVDELDSISLEYGPGQLAHLACSFRSALTEDARICGTEGVIRLLPDFSLGTQVALRVRGQSEELAELPFDGNGYGHEAAEVMLRIREGRLESPLMPLDETLAILETTDRLRAQWGFKYPME